MTNILTDDPKPVRTVRLQSVAVFKNKKARRWGVNNKEERTRRQKYMQGSVIIIMPHHVPPPSEKLFFVFH